MNSLFPQQIYIVLFHIVTDNPMSRIHIEMLHHMTKVAILVIKGGRRIFSGLTRWGEQFFKVAKGGGGKVFLNVEMDSPELVFSILIA